MAKLFSLLLGVVVSLVFVANASYALDLKDTGKSIAGESAKGAVEGGKSAVKGKVEQIDINTAPVDKLKTLPGIGDAYAKKIVDNRPYASKSQLKSKKVIPAGVYDKVSGLIVATQPGK